MSQSRTQAATDPLSPIRIEVTGKTANAADITWTLYKSNRSEITVNILRDGVTLHTSTGSTDIGPVDLSYGSYAW